MTTNDLTEQQIKTRTRLMNATVQVILEQGYEATTITDIAESADHARWTFYQYFKNKDDILFQILVDWLSNMIQNVLADVQHLQTPEREYMAWKKMTGHLYENRQFFRRLEQPMEMGMDKLIHNFFEGHLKYNLEQGHVSLGNTIPDKMLVSLHVASSREIMRQVLASADIHEVNMLVDNYFRFMFRQEPPITE